MDETPPLPPPLATPASSTFDGAVESRDALLAHWAGAAPPILTRGTTLGAQGRYEVLEPIGAGAFGAVYAARDVTLGRRVAVKVLHDRRAQPVEMLALARLQHESIVTLYDHVEVGGHISLVVEWVDGETLAERIARGPLSTGDAAAIVLRVLRALEQAHARGVLHRDLKPANILLSRRGDVKVADFGVAYFRMADASLEAFGARAPQAAAVMEQVPLRAGTPAYMAPEQRAGGAPDARSDLYACGLILCEALAGERPAADVAPAQFLQLRRPSLSPRWVSLIARATNEEPMRRFQDAASMATELSAVDWPVEQVLPEQPYRYLDAFSEADAPLFFGRESAVTALQLTLNRQPLVLLAGPSGAGKSSLVAAGLIPRLRRGSPRWDVVTLRVGATPLLALSEAVAELVGAADAPSELQLRASPGRLGQVLRTHANTRGTSTLLFVDQLEALFTQGASAPDRQAFLRALASATDDPKSALRVVATMRDDFVHWLAEDEGLADRAIEATLRLPRPELSELREAALGPARLAGYTLEVGLADELTAALQGEPTPLPLLQLTLSRLWEVRDEATRTLTRGALSTLGGVSGVLAQHAEAVLAELPSPGDVDVARRVFTLLVTAARTNRGLRREELVERVGDSAGTRVLEHLLRRRLLSARRAAESTQVDLPSETLLQQWTRFQHWLTEDSADALRHERLRQAAQHWHERGRARELLWSGPALAEAAGLAERLGPRLSADERTFVDDARRRDARRRRARVLLLVATIVGLSSLAGASYWAATRVAEERDAARLQRGEAMSLARAVLFKVSEKVSDLRGATPVLAELVDSAVRYFRTHVDAHAGAAEERRTLALAYIKIGDIAYKLRRPNDGREAYERANALFEALAAELGGTSDVLRGWSLALTRLGLARARKGAGEDWKAPLVRGTGMRHEWARATAKTADAWSEVSAGYYDLCDASHMAGDSATTRRATALGIQSAETALRLRPHHLGAQRELARALVAAALLDTDEHKYADADRRLERAYLLRKAAAEREPNSLAATLELLSVQQKRATGLTNQRRFDEAERALLALEPVVARAVRLDPDAFSTRMQEVLYHARLTFNALRANKSAAALAHARREVAVGEALTARPNISVTGWRQLQLGYNRAANAALLAGDVALAADWNGKSLALCARFLAKDEKNAEWRYSRAATLHRAAEAAFSQKDYARGRGPLETALSDWALLRDRSPKDAALQLQHARSLRLRAEAALDQGAHAGATLDATRAARDLRQLAAPDLADPETQAELAMLESVLGRAQESVGQTAAARAALSSSLQRAEGLLRAEPGDITLSSVWALTRAALGVGRVRAGDLAAGRALLREAQGRMAALTREFPRNPFLRRDAERLSQLARAAR